MTNPANAIGEFLNRVEGDVLVLENCCWAEGVEDIAKSRFGEVLPSPTIAVRINGQGLVVETANLEQSLTDALSEKFNLRRFDEATRQIDLPIGFQGTTQDLTCIMAFLTRSTEFTIRIELNGTPVEVSQAQICHKRDLNSHSIRKLHAKILTANNGSLAISRPVKCEGESFPAYLGLVNDAVSA